MVDVAEHDEDGGHVQTAQGGAVLEVRVVAHVGENAVQLVAEGRKERMERATLWHRKFTHIAVLKR